MRYILTMVVALCFSLFREKAVDIFRFESMVGEEVGNAE